MPNGPGSAGRRREGGAIRSALAAGLCLAVSTVFVADAAGADNAPPRHSSSQLAQTYLDGRTLKSAPPFVIRRYRERAEAGQARAQFFLGLMYEQELVEGASAPDRSARDWYAKAAAQGFPPAQYKYGVFLLDGRGGAKDVAAAAEMFGKAAKAGIKEAQYNYGLLLSQGRGVTRDLDAAIRWLERAALAGVTEAAMTLAEIHTAGVGRPADPVEAWAWLRRADESGSLEARRLLETLTARMSDEQVKEARKLKEAHDALARIRSESD